MRYIPKSELESCDIKATYICGHTVTHASPGVSDPVGLLNLMSLDGKVNLAQECYDCRKVEGTTERVLKHLGIERANAEQTVSG